VEIGGTPSNHSGLESGWVRTMAAHLKICLKNIADIIYIIY
jgi:hypothetical protein